MVMSWIYTGILAVSLTFSLFLGTGPALAAAVSTGAQAGVSLAVSIAGSVCLWTGAGKLMEHIGLTEKLSRLFRPLLHRCFPSSEEDPALRASLSANLCANLLGLGNAATPMGIRAARRLRDPGDPARATDGLCRLVVLNTASIQLLPTTVAALRRSAGCMTPFDILPCVWITSSLSVCAGLLAAWVLGRVWRG